MIALPWLLIFPALLLILDGRWLKAGFWLFAMGYLAALAVDQMDWSALAAISVLGLAGFAVPERRPAAIKAAGVLLFLLAATALRAHIILGFRNPLVFDAQVSAAAARYRMYLNLDEALIIAWVVYAWKRVTWSRNYQQSLWNGLAVGLIAATTCIFSGWVLGLVEWDPKWPPGAWIWVINNLVLVSLGEELFFRGFIQSGLERLWEDRRYGAVAALWVSAVLFGISHWSAGLAYAAVAVLAGLGYGIAYKRGGLQAAVLAHSVLNLIHFSLFTYPAIQR